ncbi:hypothetical protein GCM10010510_59430 [Streptomyces anandii JCM 4720]|nr:hypothetical protein GCM10010510_59430 [Streptomyces anandii JCM 4720]
MVWAAVLFTGIVSPGVVTVHLPVECKEKVMPGTSPFRARTDTGRLQIRPAAGGPGRAMMGAPTAYRPFESARESPQSTAGAPKEQVPPLNLSGTVTARARHI